MTLPSSRHYGFSVFSWWRTSSHWTLITCMVFGQQLLNSLDLGVGVDLLGDIMKYHGIYHDMPKIG